MASHIPGLIQRWKFSDERLSTSLALSQGADQQEQFVTQTPDAACLYLTILKVCRFTPFSNDAQARIRGKCPLELAGYDVLKLPMAGAKSAP